MAQAAALESVMIGVLSLFLDVRQGPVMRLLEVTWGWIHYRVVEIKGKVEMVVKSSYYAGASVFKEAFCAGVECEAT